GDVVEDRVAEDVSERVFDADMASGLADHDGQLRLVVELCRYLAVPRNGVPRADDARRGLQEEFGLLASQRGLRLLFVVIRIVASGGEDDRRRERSQESDVGDAWQRKTLCVGNLPRPLDLGEYLIATGNDRVDARQRSPRLRIEDAEPIIDREQVDQMTIVQHSCPRARRVDVAHELQRNLPTYPYLLNEREYGSIGANSFTEKGFKWE